MVKLGGNNFHNCPVPLAFEGRYFILEDTSEGPLISVVLEYEGKPMFEVFKNEPTPNPITDVSITAAGILAVAEKDTGRFVYKVRPGSETSVVFGSIRGEDLTVTIRDRRIRVGTNIFENNTIVGSEAGMVIDRNGGIVLGALLPASLLALFQPA